MESNRCAVLCISKLEFKNNVKNRTLESVCSEYDQYKECFCNLNRMNLENLLDIYLPLFSHLTNLQQHRWNEGSIGIFIPEKNLCHECFAIFLFLPQSSKVDRILL